MRIFMRTSMRTFLSILLSIMLPVLGLAQTIHATAQCESIKANVLGIRDLQTCNIGVTNYSAQPVVVTEAMVREWFTTLDIENVRRAKAVADKAFNNSKKSRAIAAFNFISPLAVALMGGGLIGFSAQAAVKAVTGTSLANSAAQSFKSYLIGQQPDESAFLPDLPPYFVLGPYGTTGNTPFSVVYTVLGSIDYTSGSATAGVTAEAMASSGTGRKKKKKRTALRFDWKGDLPVLTGPLPTAAPAPAPLPPSAATEGEGASSFSAAMTITSRGMTLRIIPQPETLGLMAANLAQIH